MQTSQALSVLAVLCALLACASCSGQALLTAYQTSQPPRLDGVLTDPCWQAAAVSSPFLSASGPGLPEAQTEVRVCWDDQSLYLGIEAREPYLDPKLNMLHLVKAEATGRDASVFSEDCLEVFLQPGSEAYYHFATNSGTGRYEARNRDAAWNGDWECVTSRGMDRWTAEMAIPLSSLKAKASGEWRVNFARERSAVKELSTWCGLQNDFHATDAYGKLHFAQSGPALGPVTLEPRAGEVTLRSNLRASATGGATVEAQLQTGSQTVKAQTRASGNVALRLTPPAAAATGEARLTYRLLQDGIVLLQSAPMQTSLGGLLADLALRSADVRAEVVLNGVPVKVEAEATKLALHPGLNVLALTAESTGPHPVLQPQLSLAQRPLPSRWLTRTQAPSEDWTQAIPGKDWTVVSAGQLWPEAQAGVQRLWAVCAMYLPLQGPQLFPRTDTCYLPRGSRQFVRLNLHLPPELPTNGYSMFVEVPDAVRCVALDPLGSVMPEMTSEPVSAEGGTGRSRYRLRYSGVPGDGIELSLRWGDESGGTLAYQPSLRTGGTHDWRHLTAEVTAPAGATNVRPLVIKWQDRGVVGTAWVDNVVFREADSKQNLLKMGTLDEPTWGNHGMLKPEGPDGSRCIKIVSTAETANRQQALWVDKEGSVPVKAGRKYVVEMDVRCADLRSPSTQPLVGLLLEAPADLPLGEMPLYTYCEVLDGTVTEIPSRSRLVVLPALKNVQPARARICPCYYGSVFTTPEVAKAFADNCRASGITWTYGRSSNDVIPHLLPQGHKVILSLPWEPWSTPPGTTEWLEQHPELQAQNFSGKPMLRTICPTWFLDQGKEPLAKLEEWVLRLVSTEDCAGVDWDFEQSVLDPPTFCTCGRCLKEFRQYGKLPADAVLNPQTLQGQYRRLWTDFRCEQNAQMAGKLREILRKADRPIEFSIYSGYQGERTREHYGVDWFRMARFIDFGIAGYNGRREEVYGTVEALGKVPFMGGEMWYLSDRDSRTGTPRMETWRNRLLRQYVESGCEGCLIWYLPPMDGGAFYTTSEATELIARYEDYFVASQRCDARVKVAGLPETDWAAFAHEGKILVLLMNFRGERASAEVSFGDATTNRTVAPYGCEVVLIDDTVR